MFEIYRASTYELVMLRFLSLLFKDFVSIGERNKLCNQWLVT
ncbi:hypothetical protein HanRHA438_Chr16g0746001 [Helianthus annuus]|nr:hypothetical protein HanHA300_Chr16g0598111 [Helianthus annuus]KAJ0441441.1 hypothetical protein HanIR_Chr16g0797791 [Helianthus annuus]KAJ0459403.1 hypothetical protein HanHA89_Chr16g0648581 [Helianthus annuus]KAJ0639933.1 hypothetical protein HanLR1_Chr16g0609421 [Helianthus annuus]KAJ0834645.1 hypothetical protein HanRHA438_Chr16g0746001 [Helianthus annuus]